MISTTTRKVSFIGNDVTTVFPFAFKVFTSADLVVVRTNVSTGVESTLVLNSDYTVLLNADQDNNPGGSVTTSPTLATGLTLVISSDIPNLQATEISNLGGFFPEVITNAFDKLTILDQQQQEEIDRSLKLPISDAALNTELPIASLRAGKVLGFDAVTGAPTVVASSAGAPGAPGAPGATGTLGNNSGFSTTKVAAPANPASTDLAVWADSTDGILHVKDSTGANVAPTGRPEDKGHVNVITDGGVTGTPGVTDDYAKIQALITANPGKVIFFPKRVAAISGGSTGNYGDYFCSQQLVFPAGNGTLLRGAGPSTWSGAVRILFATNTPGIRIPTTAYSCGLENIEIFGPDAWNDSDSSTWENWANAAALTGTGPDGIQCLGGEPYLSRVTVGNFKRHGIYIDGAGTITNPSQPDLWHIDNCMVLGNRGYGAYIAGSDSNAGLGHIRCRYNNLGGIYNFSVLGNTFLSQFTDGNTRDHIAAGANIGITSITVASNIATIVTASPHAWTVGKWITTVPTDGTFASTGKLLTASGSTATYAFTKADSSTGAGGNAATSTSAQIYAQYTANGLTFGPMVTSSGSARNLVLNPYSEAAVQQKYKFGSTTMVIDGNHAVTDMDWTGNPVWFTHNAGGFNAYGTQPFKILNPTDNLTGIDIVGGSTINPTKPIRWFQADGTTKQFELGPQSSALASLPYLYLKDNAGNFVFVVNQSGTFDFAPIGGVKFGGGTPVKQIKKITSVAVDLGSIAATSRGATAVTVSGTPGIAAGDAIQVIAGINGFNDDLIFEGAEATGANSVTFYFYNPTGAPIDDTSHNVDILWTDLT